MGQIRTIRDIINRLRENSKGYLRKYFVYLALTALAAMADMVSTMYIMLLFGPEAERHPTIRLAATILGPFVGPIVGKLWQLAAVITLTIYLRYWAVYIFVTVIFLYGWAAWYNIWGWNIYYPRILTLLDYLPF